MLFAMLFAINGEAFITLLVTLVIVGLIFYVLWWALAKIAPPEPFYKVIQTLLVLAAALFVINALLALVGREFIHW